VADGSSHVRFRLLLVFPPPLLRYGSYLHHPKWSPHHPKLQAAERRKGERRKKEKVVHCPSFMDALPLNKEVPSKRGPWMPAPLFMYVVITVFSIVLWYYILGRGTIILDR
jgi:hypothetical protein